MLRLTPIDVAPLEKYSTAEFRDWLTAGYKDLARPDTSARAFAPLHLLVGHGDITTELKSVYDVLSGVAQIYFRRGLADAISALPTEVEAIPVLRRLLHLAGRMKALEVLPKLMPQVGAGFFGIPDRDEGRELFALAIDLVAGMAPASGTADTLRNLVGSAFFRPGYAPLALVALCRAEPERFTEHLYLLRGHFAKLHTDHGVGNAAITARRVAHYVPLNVMASSLKALQLAVVVPDSDRWLVDALFVGEESPLEINIEQSIMFLSRRGGKGREPVQLPEGTEQAREFRSQLQDLIFKSALERLLEDQVVVSGAVPLTPNGKVDRKALPAPERGVAEGYVPPCTPTEELLAGIWAEVLRQERVGRQDNFFALGGIRSRQCGSSPGSARSFR